MEGAPCKGSGEVSPATFKKDLYLEACQLFACQYSPPSEDVFKVFSLEFGDCILHGLGAFPHPKARAPSTSQHQKVSTSQGHPCSQPIPSHKPLLLDIWHHSPCFRPRSEPPMNPETETLRQMSLCFSH